MRAAVLNENHAFDVVDLPDPRPQARELVLRVRSCGICGSDLKAHTMLPAGTVLGHEFCGEITAIGADTGGRWREGQLVASMPLQACGSCRWCLADEPVHCANVDLLGVGGSAGAFAEYVRVAANKSVAVAEGAGDLGALVEPLAVGLHTASAAGISAGDRVFVIGGGNVGAASSVWARRLGAGEIVVSDPASTRRDTAAQFGATSVHDPNNDPAPSGFDVVLECVGAPGMVHTAIDAAAARGRVVIAGVCTAPDQFVPIAALMKELQIRFAVYYSGKEFAAAASLIAEGGFNAEAFVSGHVGLNGVTDAFNKLLTTVTERKILVKP